MECRWLPLAPRFGRDILRPYHLGVGSIDLEFAKAGLDNRAPPRLREGRFLVSSGNSLRTPPSASEARVRAPLPVGQHVDPARLLGEVGGAQNADQKTRRADIHMR